MSPCRCTWITSTWVSEVMTVGHLVCTPSILCPRSPTSSQSDFALLIHKALQGNLRKQSLNKRWKTDILANDLQVFKLERVTHLSLWPVLNNYIHFLSEIAAPSRWIWSCWQNKLICPIYTTATKFRQIFSVFVLPNISMLDFTSQYLYMHLQSFNKWSQFIYVLNDILVAIYTTGEDNVLSIRFVYQFSAKIKILNKYLPTNVCCNQLSSIPPICTNAPTYLGLLRRLLGGCTIA